MELRTVPQLIAMWEEHGLGRSAVVEPLQLLEQQLVGENEVVLGVEEPVELLRPRLELALRLEARENRLDFGVLDDEQARALVLGQQVRDVPAANRVQHQLEPCVAE